jgi:hypothetical protein
MIEKINLVLYKASIRFKASDIGISLVRLMYEPAHVQTEKVALDAVRLGGMYSGVNVFSMMMAGMEVAPQMYLGKYQEAFEISVGVVNAMALHYILLRANRPYIGFAYGAMFALSTLYDVISNAYSLAMEFTSSDSTLKSKIAYKNLAEKLATSWLQELYDFKFDVKEYNLEINAILFEKEQQNIKAKAQEQGEFGRKLFEYIHSPMLIEKYELLNDVVRGRLTEEEAKVLQPWQGTLTNDLINYDLCREAKNLQMVEKGFKHYYCCSMEEQVIDHVVMIGDGGLEVIERL